MTSTHEEDEPNRIQFQHRMYELEFGFSAGVTRTYYETAMRDAMAAYDDATAEGEALAFLRNSPQLRAVRDSEPSPMWKRVHPIQKLVHEILIDPAFVFDPKKCYPTLTKRYAANPPTSMASDTFLPMLMDIQAGTLRLCRHGADAWPAVAVFDMEGVRAGLHDHEFEAYAARVAEFMLSKITNFDRACAFRTEWANFESRDNVSDVMGFLFRCGKELRIQIDNVAVQSLRTISMRDRVDLIAGAPIQYDRTRQWIRSELDLLDHHELDLVSAGEPFMLLRFHDRALANIVWNRQISAATIPEILEMDIERIHEVSTLLSLIEDTPISRYVFSELLTSNRAPRSVDYAPPPVMLDAAVKLRKIMILCRVVHGEMTMRITRVIAAESFLIRRGDDETLSTLTTIHWMPQC